MTHERAAERPAPKAPSAPAPWQRPEVRRLTAYGAETAGTFNAEGSAFTS
ncbi:MAG TPA: hypothetical protein VGD66_02115 [Allosphingosinicella sp.]|jgi:hypothetical protein